MPTEPPSHPTRGEHDGEVLGLSFLLLLLLLFLFISSSSSPFPSHADQAPTSSNSWQT